MGKYIIGGIALLLVVLGGLYYVSKTSVPIQNTQPPPTLGIAATSTYATSTYSIVYPSDFSVNDSYAYDQFGEKKLIHGVKFMIPMTMATGTNLSASDTGISIEQLPRAQRCTGDIYIPDNVKAQKVTDNGIEYSVATTSGAAAGNFYEEEVYAITASHPCTAVRYFIHSSNISNYEPGTTQEFDRTKLIETFDTIRRSLTLHQ